MEREDKEKEAEVYEKIIPGSLGECWSKQKDTEDITLRTDTIAGNNTKTSLLQKKAVQVYRDVDCISYISEVC